MSKYYLIKILAKAIAEAKSLSIHSVKDFLHWLSDGQLEWLSEKFLD